MNSTERDAPDLPPEGQQLLRQLLLVWLDFERRLERIPIVRRLEAGTFVREDYRRLLLNLRPQVVEGARWITRAASSFDAEFLDVRSIVIHHALEEHRDYELLERDFAALGGDPEEIRQAPRNVGSEALTAYLLHQASQPNPVELLGAMFIIEGLGEKMASRWARRIQELLGVGEEATAFLSYHGLNDDRHLEQMRRLLGQVAPGQAARVVKTAKVVARLYALQLEELDHV